MNNLNNVLKSREMFKKYYANKTLEAKEKRDKLEAELEDLENKFFLEFDPKKREILVERKEELINELTTLYEQNPQIFGT